MIRRILLIVTALLFLFSAVACTKTEEPTPSEEQPKDAGEQASAVPNYDYDLSPYITLGDFQDFSISEADVVPTEEALTERRESDFKGKITDRAAENGDTVIIDYMGKKDGVAFEGGTANDSPLTLGSNQFIPGFEAGLVGVFPGQTVDLNLKFPDSYSSNPDLAGQAVVFTVKMDYIEGAEDFMPELTDRLVSLLTTYDSVDAYEEGIYKQAYDDALEIKVWDAAMERVTFSETLPEDASQYYIDVFTSYYTDLASSNGYESLDAFLTAQGSNQEEFDSYAKSYADDNVKYELMVYGISRAQNISVSEEEYEAILPRIFDRYSAQNGYTSTEDMITKAGEDALRKEALYLEVIDFLIANTQIVPAADTAES